jgi:hypothetical protein
MVLLEVKFIVGENKHKFIHYININEEEYNLDEIIEKEFEGMSKMKNFKILEKKIYEKKDTEV